MTLPYERTRAVIRAREFLERLIMPPRAGGIVGVPGDVRREARWILRHYPQPFEVCRDDSFDPKAVEEHAERLRHMHGEEAP